MLELVSIFEAIFVYMNFQPKLCHNKVIMRTCHLFFPDIITVLHVQMMHSSNRGIWQGMNSDMEWRVSYCFI